MKILLLGSSGQLGQAFIHQSEWRRFNTLSLSREQLDITQFDQVGALFADYQPDVVINCAAYTAVDKAEQERAQCFAVNTDAVLNLAQHCQRLNSLLIHFSTDYVFDGSRQHAYTEQDTPAPINAYGLSKWRSEQAIQAHCTKYIILRISWLFSEFGHNFYRTMLRLAEREQAIKVVADQLGCPTYAGDVAAAVLQLLRLYQLQGQIAYGLYHLAGSPPVSWYQFAQAIFSCHQLNVQLTAVKSTEWSTLALRPAVSALNCNMINGIFNILPSNWEGALKMLAAKSNTHY